MLDRENIGVIVMILAFLGLLFGGAAVVWNQQVASTGQASTATNPPPLGGLGANTQWGGDGFDGIDQQLQAHTNAVDANPASVQPYLDRARFYESMGSTREAFDDYDTAVQIDPVNVDALTQRARLYREYGEHQSAIDDCTTILDLQPDNEVVYVMRARIRSDAGDHLGAAEDYSKAMAIAPQSANYRDRRAWEYMLLGASEAAIADYTKLIELDVDRARSLHNRGFCLYELRRYDEALADLEESVEQDHSALAYADLARVQHAMGDWDEALKSANKAVARQQDNEVRGSRIRAVIHRDLGNFDMALSDLDAALERIDRYNDPLLLHGRAWVHWTKGDLEAAASAYTRAIRFAPGELDGHMGLGVVSLYLGRLDVARIELLAATEDTNESTDYAQLFQWIAAVRSDQREHAAAILREYAQRRTAQPDGDWPATLIDFVLGDLDEVALLSAANDEQNQYRLIEKLCEVHFYAGVLQLDAGRRDSAIEHFRKAIDTRRTEFYEYEAARSELRALGVLE